MAFDFDLLEDQDPTPEEVEEGPPAEGAGSPARDATPPVVAERPSVGVASAAARRPPLPPPREIRVELATPGAGLVGELRLPGTATAAALKMQVQRLLGLHPAEQRLAVGTTVLDSDALLHEAVGGAAPELHVTVVHVPSASRVAISGCRDGTMKLWDLDCQEELSELRGGSGPVACCALDWPGRRALVGGDDCCLRLWDLERKRPVRELPGHSGRVNALAVDWGTGLALSGSSDGTLRVWDLKLGASIREMRGHTGAVLCVGFEPSLSAAISGGADCTLRLWDTETGQVTQELHGHQMAVACLVADLAGNFAVSGSIAALKIWDLRGYAWHSDLLGHTAEVTCLAVHWPTRRVMSGSTDSTLRLWCPSTGTRKTVPIFHNAARPLVCSAVFHAQHRVTCLTVDWEADQAVSGGHTGVLMIWSLRSGQLLVQLSGHSGGGVLCLSLGHGGTAAPAEPGAPGAPAEEPGTSGWPINPFFG